MTTAELWQHCGAILPELILSLAICLVVLADMLVPLRLSRRVCGGIAMAGVLAALAAAIVGRGGEAAATSVRGMIASDGLGTFFRMAFLGGTAVTVFFTMRSRETAGYRHGEFLSLLLGAALGASFMAIADNFIMLILALETLSLCSYVLAAFIKHERLSAEAGLKYLLYGAVASGAMMFGISYIYGLSGTVAIGGSMGALAAQPGLSLVTFLLALVLVLAGLGFKMAMVPFQSWCPDVYQGSPTPVTAFLSVVSKGAGLAALLRVMLPLFSVEGDGIFAGAAHLPGLFGFLAIVTMTFGNLVAVRQTNVKRLLAYSSIAHAGYLLMGMTVYRPEAIEAMLFYFFVYLIMNLGAFWVVIMVIDRTGGAELERFRGLAWRSPLLVITMFIFLISLTGLPPTAGFVAKLQLFKIVIGAGIEAMNGGAMNRQAWFYFGLAIVGVLNSVVSLYYYMNIIRIMAFGARPEGVAVPLRLGWVDAAAVLALAIPTVLLLSFDPIARLVSVF